MPAAILRRSPTVSSVEPSWRAIHPQGGAALHRIPRPQSHRRRTTMRRASLVSAIILTTLLTPRIAMPQTRFPEPDKLPSQPDFPDPLILFNGERVTSKRQWNDLRRPELKRLFQHYMYGYLPPPLPITAKIEHEDARAFDGKATLREVTISFGPPETP